MSLSGQDIARGVVQRQFKRIMLGKVDHGSSDSSSVTASVFLMNLSKSVSMDISVGVVNTLNDGVAVTYPALPGTLQITPITKGDGNDVDLLGNPIFSSPNFTGPLTIPNGWEFATMVPKARVDVVFNPTPWPTGFVGLVVLDIMAEYTGRWWDPTAVAQLLNKIVLIPGGQPFYRTGGT